jgi:hypothetical protein
MTQGREPNTPDLFNSSRDFCDKILPETSIYRLLYEHGDDFFPDVFFEDLFSRRGRHSVPPRIVATVMVLQRLEGLSDREAVERFAFDMRWKFACGGLDASYPGFVHTVLVGMRARLARSARPRRIFEVVLDVAGEAGLVGCRRALDSTPLYDAVATQDTITLIRSAIRGVLRSCEAGDETRARAVLLREDDYQTPGKPACDWDDAPAREALVDALARDGYALLSLFDGEELGDALGDAVRLLARILGQDIHSDQDGTFRIIRGVAPERIISTVDPEARHGHKTSARNYDGYKAHVAIDPDSEIICATAVTPANVGDGEMAEVLLGDLLEAETCQKPASPKQSERPQKPGEKSPESGQLGGGLRAGLIKMMAALGALAGVCRERASAEPEAHFEPAEQPCAPTRAVWGDASYGAANVVGLLEQSGVEIFCKVQPPSARKGFFSQADFDIDLSAQSVTCPADVRVELKQRADGSGWARFGDACRTCPLREQCTQAKNGRTIRVHPQFELLQRHRKAQQDEAWKAQYRQTRPKVERKLAHLVRRRHGGRRARVRGTERVDHDFSLLAAAVNLARLARLGVHRHQGEWTTAT